MRNIGESSVSSILFALYVILNQVNRPTEYNGYYQSKGDLYMSISNTGPALFFFADGELLFHGCSLENAENYGDFLNYPFSHFEIWEKNYRHKYFVDFDFYPRGRVVYRKTDDTYLIYYDKCMEPFINAVIAKYTGKKFEIGYDEHYQCHLCNKDYVL